MYMRGTGALCLYLVAAHQGWSQMHAMEQETRFSADEAVAFSSVDPGGRQQLLSTPRSDNSLSPVARISVAELRHKAPGKAFAAFTEGVKLAEAGNYRRAAHEFVRAVTIDPDYSDAHGNLGAMYVNLALPDQAVVEFRRAIELDPATSAHHANLALALILMNLPEQAEAEARTAVGLDDLNPKARYLLGFLLARKPETRNRAAEHLEYAARQLPDAHLILADMYRLEGAPALAQNEQELYRKAILDSVNAP
jgi:tetratricopeptide (TPR) repeat protein